MELGGDASNRFSKAGTSHPQATPGWSCSGRPTSRFQFREKEPPPSSRDSYFRVSVECRQTGPEANFLRFSLPSTESFSMWVFLCMGWVQTETVEWVPVRQDLPGARPQRRRFVRAASLEDPPQHFRQQCRIHLTCRRRTRKSDFQRNSNRHVDRDFRSAPRWETFEARRQHREYVTWTPFSQSRLQDQGSSRPRSRAEETSDQKSLSTTRKHPRTSLKMERENTRGQGFPSDLSSTGPLSMNLPQRRG